MSLRRSLALAAFVPAFAALQAVHWIGLLLDEVLFSGYRDVRVREPLFVVGLPRSGTTFLHGVLARDEDRFTTLRLRELVLAPSITERRLLAAFRRLDDAVGRPAGRLVAALEGRISDWTEGIHPVSLDAPEEDYLLLLPLVACFLLVLPFPHARRVWKLSRFDELPREEREPIVSFYRACLQRHLYVVGDDRTLLSKNPSFTSFLRSLLETFPDARVVCCVRDPARAVPSQLSSLRPGARVFGWDPGEPPHRKRFLDLLAYYARHALSVLDELPPERKAFVRQEKLKEDARGTVLRVYERFGWTPGADFQRRLRRAHERGRRHRSRHRYSLEEFGLSEDGVRRRFPGLVERFDYGTRRASR